MHCTNCGEVLTETSKFCGTCGSAVGRKESTPSADPKPSTDTKSSFFSGFQIAGALTILVSTAIFLFLIMTYEPNSSPATAEDSSAASNSNVDGERTPPVQRPQSFSFSDGHGEWFSESVLRTMSGNSDRRYLVIRGTIQNQTSSTTFVNIVCTAVVSVHFENGKSVDISSEDICGDPGGSAMTFMTGDTSVADLTKLKLEPGASHGVDTSTGGEITAAVVSPLFNEKYSSYPVSETQLQIQVTAETAFGDRVRETILRTNIPSPSHKARFDFM